MLRRSKAEDTRETLNCVNIGLITSRLYRRRADVSVRVRKTGKAGKEDEGRRSERRENRRFIDGNQTELDGDETDIARRSLINILSRQ